MPDRAARDFGKGFCRLFFRDHFLFIAHICIGLICVFTGSILFPEAVYAQGLITDNNIVKGKSESNYSIAWHYGASPPLDSLRIFRNCDG